MGITNNSVGMNNLNIVDVPKQQPVNNYPNLGLGGNTINGVDWSKITTPSMVNTGIVNNSDLTGGATTNAFAVNMQPVNTDVNGNIVNPNKVGIDAVQNQFENDKTNAIKNILSSDNSTNTNTNTDVINTGNAMNQTGSFTPGTNPSVPYTIPTGGITSNDLSGNNSYSDVLARQQQYQNMALQALQNQLGTQYTQMGNVLEAKYSGDTTDYGAGAGFLAQQRADIQNLKATIPMQVASQGVGYAQQNLQNVLSAQQQLGNFQISQTGDVIGTQRDPRTGAVIPQNFGNVYDGTYGGQVGPANMLTQQGTNQQNSNGIYGSQGYSNINQIQNPFVKSAVVDMPVGSSGSLQFVQLDKLPDYLKNIATKQATQAGIPTLDANGANAVYAAQQILDIVDAAKALSIRNLASGPGGHITDAVKNWANNFLQFNPDLSNFDQLRDAASKATTALAGGNGSGFRMNMGIIEAAVQNLPRASDSLETALTRADALGTQIINGLKPKFPNVQYGGYGNLLQSQYTTNQPSISGGTTGNSTVGWY